jgi:uncharacterized protein YbjT (DUF2867 family)
LQVVDELTAAKVELVEGDLLQPDSLPAAVQGVDVVVSCVMGDERTMVEGQTNLLEAAKAAGVKKARPARPNAGWPSGSRLHVPSPP